MKLVGERRAIAAIIFAFYFIIYLMNVLSGALPEEFEKLYYAIAGVYAVAFFGLVAGYFWARWYAVGVGLYGVILGVVALWKLGTHPMVLFIGGTHLLATLALWGSSMSAPFDGQTAWRERYHMDDNAVQRLGRSVIRAGVSLPFILAYALAPKPEEMMLASLVALGLAGFGYRALLQMKTWGIFALGAAGGLLVTLAAMSSGLPATATWGGELTLGLVPAIAGGLLLMSTAPFAGPILQRLRL